MSIIIHHLPVRRVSGPERHHFFGYFDKFPWDRSGRYLLSHEVDFVARQPQPGDRAVAGMYDLAGGDRFIPLGVTGAWCWQQGSMLQWLNDRPHTIIYNDREEGRFVARTLDVHSGASRTLCRPVYCLSPDGRWALSLNFSRLDRERPGYGYAGGEDPGAAIHAPEDDGIWLVDLQANSARLVVSVAAVTRAFHRESMEGAMGWFNHLLFSPDSRRFAFFHRWRVGTGHLTHMFTANLDGSGLCPLNLDDMSSHYVWTGNDRIINFSRRLGRGDHYYLYTDQSDRVDVVAQDVFPYDGHCSYSPDGRWMLTDSYPLADHGRRLYLYHLAERQGYEIGCFHADPSYPGPTRCDLHPNWSRDGLSVCIDSIHEGSRQVYTIDVSELVRR